MEPIGGRVLAVFMGIAFVIWGFSSVHSPDPNMQGFGSLLIFSSTLLIITAGYGLPIQLRIRTMISIENHDKADQLKAAELGMSPDEIATMETYSFRRMMKRRANVGMVLAFCGFGTVCLTALASTPWYVGISFLVIGCLLLFTAVRGIFLQDFFRWKAKQDK